MSSTEWGDLIRRPGSPMNSAFLRGLSEKNLDVLCRPFSNSIESTEYFLFYSCRGKLWYPAWLEFRLINNNVLFLILEYRIHSFRQLAEILNSSLEKLEHRATHFRAIVAHTESPPRLAVELADFIIEPEFCEEVQI